MREGISTVVTVSNDLLSLNKDNTIDDAINLISEKLKALDYFDSFAVYKIKDLIDFNQSFCFPEIEKQTIEKDVEEHINNGTFSWALNNKRPVVVTGPVSGCNQVLFSLSTKRRIHGMFIANAKNKGEISGVSLEILQLILSITVFSIDNLQLAEQLTIHVQNLEVKVSERTKELTVANLQLEKLSLTDTLTELPNRRHAIQLLSSLWDEALHKGSPLACIMVDADHFKEVNDNYGHDAGDEVLKVLAKTLQDSLRNDDTVYRLGGDEFLIICPDKDKEGGMHLAESIRKTVSKLRVPTGGEPWHGSVSIGVSYRLPDMKSYEDLIKMADFGIYAAKVDGKNCVRSVV